MEGQYLIQPRKDDAHDFDSAYYTTNVTPRPGSQPHVSAVRDTTSAQPLYQATDHSGANSYGEFLLPIYGEDQQAAYPTGDMGVPVANAPFIAPLPSYGTIDPHLQATSYAFDLDSYWFPTAGQSLWLPPQQTGLFEWASFGTVGATAGPSISPQTTHGSDAQVPLAISAGFNTGEGLEFVRSEQLEGQLAWLSRPPLIDRTNGQPDPQRVTNHAKIGYGEAESEKYGNAEPEDRLDTHQDDAGPRVPSHSLVPRRVSLKVDTLGEASSPSIELTAQQNNTYTHGSPKPRASNGSTEDYGYSKKKVTNRARKERERVRQKSSATRATLATPVTATPPQHPANWCTECKAVISGGIWNFQAHIRREHERPDVLPCTLCGDEFSAHRGAEFFTMHLFGRNRWTQCKKVKEIYGVTGGHGNIEITSDNIGVLGRWIEQHRQDIVDARFTCHGQWTVRSTISRMLKRWEKTSQTSGGTTTMNNAGG